MKMNRTIKSPILLIIISVTFGTSGWAASPGGVIRGNTNINVTTKNITTMASDGAVAKTRIGSVKGSTTGKTNVTVNVDNVSNVVSGQGQKGCINIGTRGMGPDCD
jgi:hypothetical protein